MSIDRKDIDKVIGLSKKDFEEKLAEAVNSVGIDEKISKTLIRDSDKIKKTLESLTDKEISDLSETLKKNNLVRIEEIIKNASGK